MAPKSIVVPSGRVRPSADRRWPAGRRAMSSPGFAHLPGMRRLTVTASAAGSLIASSEGPWCGVDGRLRRWMGRRHWSSTGIRGHLYYPARERLLLHDLLVLAEEV